MWHTHLSLPVVQCGGASGSIWVSADPDVLQSANRLHGGDTLLGGAAAGILWASPRWPEPAHWLCLPWAFCASPRQQVHAGTQISHCRLKTLKNTPSSAYTETSRIIELGIIAKNKIKKEKSYIHNFLIICCSISQYLCIYLILIKSLFFFSQSL